MTKQQANKQGNEAIKIIAQNRKARFNFHILDTFEAGIVLTGAEIKSIRQGNVTLSESYVRPIGKEVFLLGCHINPYTFSSDLQYDATRPRKLLLHESEIDKLRGRVEEKGLTVVPLSLYLKKGRAKLEIALARGKDAPDKRESIKERESKREMSRFLKES